MLAAAVSMTSFAPMESIFTLSKSLHIPYIVHYVPFTIQTNINSVNK